MGTAATARPLNPWHLASLEAAIPFGFVITARVFLAAGVLTFSASAIETSAAPRGIHYADWIAELCQGPSAAMFAFALILGPMTWPAARLGWDGVHCPQYPRTRPAVKWLTDEALCNAPSLRTALAKRCRRPPTRSPPTQAAAHEPCSQAEG